MLVGAGDVYQGGDGKEKEIPKEKHVGLGIPSKTLDIL